MGDPFTMYELEREAGYLTERGFITDVAVAEFGPGILNPQLTAAGRDCVMDFGGNVSDYLNPRQGGATNITMTNSTGQIVVASENVIQNVNSGLDTRKLLEFAGFVRQVLPTLGLADDQQSDLDSTAEELHNAGTVVAPDAGRLKKLVDALLGGLTKAAPSVVTSTAIAMGNEAIHALTSH